MRVSSHLMASEWVSPLIASNARGKQRFIQTDHQIIDTVHQAYIQA